MVKTVVEPYIARSRYFAHPKLLLTTIYYIILWSVQVITRKPGCLPPRLAAHTVAPSHQLLSPSLWPPSWP